MPNMTLAIPEDLRKIMRKHNEIKWSEVARMSLWSKAEQLEWMDRVTAKSKLTEEDIEEFDRKIKKGIARRVRELSSTRTG
jgi:hypothetical protein